MNSIPHWARRRPALGTIAAAVIAALGVTLLTNPGRATAQEEIDCTALGDDRMASSIGGAFDTASACGVEVRIENRSYPYLTYSVTPEGRLHLTETAAPDQHYRDEGIPDPTLEDWEGSLLPVNSPWFTALRYTDTQYPLFESDGGTLDWTGDIPVPTYSGSTAVYDELNTGLDLEVEVGVSSTEFRFEAADADAWGALASGLSVGDQDWVSVEAGSLVYLTADWAFGTSVRATPFAVRDAAGTVSMVDLGIGADGTIQMSLPDGAAESAAYPLTLSTQMMTRDFGVTEWGSVTSASPDLTVARGAAGLDQPYFEAAGESGTALVGEYCDAFVSPECTETAESASYWNFQWPVTGRDQLPDYQLDFTFPVVSASFQVDAAEGTGCVAPDLYRTEEYRPSTTWTGRPAADSSPVSGTCDEGTATYDVTGAVHDGWLDDESTARIGLGMPGSTETARFDGDSARLDVYFQITGVYATELCNLDPNNPEFELSNEFSHLYARSWRSDLIDLGLTFTASVYDHETAELVLTTDPQPVSLDENSILDLNGEYALPDGWYEVIYHITAAAGGFEYTSDPCQIGIDTVAPDIVEINPEQGPHHIGDTVSIEVTVADDGPDGASELSVWLQDSSLSEVYDSAVLQSASTVTLETELRSTTNHYRIQVEDQVPHETISEVFTISAVDPNDDYDGDGHADLVTVRRSDGDLVFYPGLGDGTLGSSIAVGTGWGGMDVVMAGDLTGDGLPDLVARSMESGLLYTYPGDGRGGYVYAERMVIGHNWDTISVFTSGGDFDHDGDLDILGVRASDGTLFLYPGQGDGTLGARVAIDTGWGGFDSLTTVDSLDGDSFDDVIARSSSTGQYYMYYGRSDGTLWFYGYPEPPSLVDEASDRRYRQVATAGDLDEDGHDDLVAVDSRTGELVRLSFDDQGEPLHSGHLIGTGWGAMRLPVVEVDDTYDYDGDDVGDVVARRASDGDLYFYPGDGEGDLDSRSLMGPGWDSMNLIETAGDVDGDGIADILARHASTGVLYVYPGDGFGGYSYGDRFSLGTWRSMDTIAGGHDYNGDGFVDIIAREASTGYLWLYPGSGGGDFGSRERVGHGWNSMREINTVGDLDGDGLADLIAVRKSDGCLYFYPGLGSGGFGSRSSMGCGWNSMDALTGVGDCNGDGLVDFLARRISDGNLYLYPGDGDGDYVYSDRFLVGVNWNTIDAIA